jgi:hypothetical protein
LTYTADTGEVNNVDVDVDGSGHILISDSGAVIDVGSSGCSSTDDNRVDCGVPSAEGYSGVSLVLGDQIDTAGFEPDLPLSTRRADGGEDNDVLNAGNQDVTLIGGPGEDNLNGGDVNDTIEGDSGNDTIDATAGGQDTIDAGAGEDKIYTNDTSSDSITCGPDTDRVDADSSDAINFDCEEDIDGNPLPAGLLTEPPTNMGPTLFSFNGQASVSRPPQPFHFEWGLTTAYGVGVPATTISSNGRHPVSAAYHPEWLPGGRPLHARLVAGTVGTDQAAANDVVFTMPNRPPAFVLPRALGGHAGPLTAAASVSGTGFCSRCDQAYDAEPKTVDLPVALQSRSPKGATFGRGLDVVGPSASSGLPHISPSAHLEFGRTRDYDKSTPEVPGTGFTPAPPPNFRSPDPLARANLLFHLKDLRPATEYHARLDSTTYGGFSQSPDFVIDTPPGISGGGGTFSASVSTCGQTGTGCATATMTFTYDCIGVGDEGCGGSADVSYTFTVSTARVGKAAKPTGKRIALGHAKFKIRAHHKGRIRVKLTRKGRKLLKHRKKLRVQVLYRTRGRGGRTLKTAAPLLLVRKKH